MAPLSQFRIMILLNGPYRTPGPGNFALHKAKAQLNKGTTAIPRCAGYYAKPAEHPPPCARWPGTPGSMPGSWLAGHLPWVWVWAGAFYWHGVGG